MLPIKNRLVKKNDFDQVFKGGKSFKEGFLVFKMKSGTMEQARFGFVVSKKISPKAVVRNTVKRRLRKITEQYLAKTKKPIDGIFITLPGIEKIAYLKLQETVEVLLKKANV